MIAPLMTCSARLPVYALIIGAFIPRRTLWGGLELQGVVLFALYILGVVGAMAVAFVIKRTIMAGEIGNDASEQEAAATAARFAGHSLRSGLATSAAANRAPGHLIQRQLRHKKYDTTAGYIQAANLLTENAAGMAGL